MRKFRLYSLLITAVLLITACGSTKQSTNEQKSRKGGVVHYDVDLELPGMKELVDTLYMNYYWGNKTSKNNLVMMGMNMNVIHNKDSMLLLMKTRRNDSVATKATTQQFNEEFGMQNLVSIDTTDETDTIVGYETIKTIYETKNNGTMTLWCNSELDIPLNSLQFYHSKIQGYPLKIEMKKQGRRIFIINAERVTKEYPGDEHFRLNIPNNFENQDFDEVENLNNF